MLLTRLGTGRGGELRRTGNASPHRQVAGVSEASGGSPTDLTAHGWEAAKAMQLAASRCGLEEGFSFWP